MKAVTNKKQLRGIWKDTPTPGVLNTSSYTKSSSELQKNNSDIDKLRQDLELLSRKFTDLSSLSSGATISSTTPSVFVGGLRSSVDFERRDGVADSGELSKLHLLETILARIGELDRLVCI